MRGWTERELYQDNSRERIDQLRWAWYVDQLAETATLNLEQSAEDLAVREQLNRASNDRVRQAIEDGQTAKVRADIGRMFEVRKKVRLTLLLPEVPPRG